MSRLQEMWSRGMLLLRTKFDPLEANAAEIHEAELRRRREEARRIGAKRLAGLPREHVFPEKSDPRFPRSKGWRPMDVQGRLPGSQCFVRWRRF